MRITVRPPFPSADKVIKEVNEALKEAPKEAPKDKALPGSSSVETAIRCWAVHLLNTKCGLTNRKGINLWNSEIGGEIGFPLTMNEGDSTASSGEIQFSGDRGELLERIRHYNGTIPTDYSMT